jgi:transposase
MKKYSDDTRVAAARDYCSGTLGYKEVARRHGVNVSSLRLWAASYKRHGAEGVTSRRRRTYTAKFKLAVLQRIQNEKLSLRRAAALFNIRNRDMILLWQRAYDTGGPAALHPYLGTRSIAMNEQPGDKSKDDSKRSRQELLDELQKLRMENAYLKKLKALARIEESAHDKEPKSCRS